MKKIIQKRQNKFIVHPSFKIYHKKVIKKAVEEFPGFVSWKNKTVEIKTEEPKDVLEWFNYLIYERKKIV